jgi:hypothetical protein
MKFIGCEREEEAEIWARGYLKLDQPPKFFRAFSAVDNADEFVCVVIMTNFSPRNIDMNIVVAQDKKMLPQKTVEMFNHVFDFVFNKLNAARVTGLVRGKNQRCVRACKHFGFKLEGVMRKAFPDDDLHVYGFLAEEYNSHSWRRG